MPNVSREFDQRFVSIRELIGNICFLVVRRVPKSIGVDRTNVVADGPTRTRRTVRSGGEISQRSERTIRSNFGRKIDDIGRRTREEFRRTPTDIRSSGAERRIGTVGSSRKTTFGHHSAECHSASQQHESTRETKTCRREKQIEIFQEDVQTNAQATVQAFASNSERLLILFDDILTADEIVRTSNDGTT